MKEDKVVTYKMFDTDIEAELVKSLLDSAGIETLIQNDLLAGMFPTAGALLKVRLFINEEDISRADEILSAGFDEEEFARETGTKPRKKKEAAK